MKLLKNQKVLDEKTKKLLNAIAKRLLEGWVTKEELAQEFNLDERRVRDCISMIAKKTAVISLSNGKGYKRAVDYKDFELAINARNELNSRIRELEARRDSLNNFLNQFAYAEMRGEDIWHEKG